MYHKVVTEHQDQEAMNEEEEFGMSKTSRDADPMEQEDKSAVKDHPDFNFLDAQEIRAAVASEDKRQVPQWMTHLPVDKDPSQWTILEVQIRPDRSWEVIQDLIATVCISKGLLVVEEHSHSVLFRKKVTQESVAHGMANTATYLNVYVHIGVSPSKLRVVDICTLVSDENKLLGGMMSTSKSLWTGTEHQTQTYTLDQLLGAIQATLLSQCLSLSHLYMSTPDNSMDSVENAELDGGYVADLKKAFSSEMKANMRDLCIPLESYAYDQEFACALLIGLLEPMLKKYGITLHDSSAGGKDTKSGSDGVTTGVEALSVADEAAAQNEDKKPAEDFSQTRKPSDASPSTEKTAPENTNKIYGEVISELVQKLWRECKEDCETKLKAKIEEKQQQVTARVEAVQALRSRAIQTILEVDGATVSSLKSSTPNDRSNVLLYEASCIVNGIPVTLHVTYGNLVYRTMVPVFASTTAIPFEDVVNVVQTTSFGIQVVSVELNPAKHAKGLTIAMGLEVDLLFQLVFEVGGLTRLIHSMHQREAKKKADALPQETERNPAELKKIFGTEEEETKEDDEEPSAATATATSSEIPAASSTPSS